MQDRHDLHEPFFLEQSIPDVVAEGMCADVTESESAGRWLVRVFRDPIQGAFDRVETAVRFVWSVLVEIRLDVAQVSLGVGEKSGGVAHAVRRARRRAFHSSSVMKLSGFASASATRCSRIAR